jgi:haloalkane dehalogenase
MEGVQLMPPVSEDKQITVAQLSSVAPSWPAHAEYPFTSRWFPLAGGHRLHYLDEGSGLPVVFVHGNPTWSFYFRHLIGRLRHDFRCLAPDHVGCGRSDQPPPTDYPYTLQRRIDDFEAFLQHTVPTGPLALVVHDWGGAIGLGWAARHPHRLAALIAMNTAAFPKPPQYRLPVSLWLARCTRLGRLLMQHTDLFCRLAARWCVVRRRLPPDIRSQYLWPYRRPRQRWAIWRFVQNIPLRPTDPGFDLLHHIAASFPHWQNIPTLLLWGLADFVFNHHFLNTWRQLLPQAQVHTWADAGHYLLEDARDDVIDLTHTFLLKHYAT